MNENDEHTVEVSGVKEMVESARMQAASNEKATNQTAKVFDTLLRAIDEMPDEIADAVSSAIVSALEKGARFGNGNSVSGANKSALSPNGEGEPATEKLSDSVRKLKDGSDKAKDALDDVSKAAGEMRRTVGEDNSGLMRNLGNLGGSLSKLSGTLGRFQDMMSRATSLLGDFAGTVSIAKIGYEVLTRGLDEYQKFADLSISQTGNRDDITLGAREWLQAKVESEFSGLSEQEAKAIQSGLISNRVAFGTEDYNRGYQFVRSTRLNYAMDVDKATDLYVKAVVRGGMTTDELNDKLNALAMQANETGVTMTELTNAYSNALDAFTKMYGAGVGSELATAYAGMYNSPEMQSQAQSAAMGLDTTIGSYDLALYEDYRKQGFDDAAAQLMAATQSGLMKGGEYADVIQFPLDGRGGKSLYDFIQTQDWDGLEDALQQLKDSGSGMWLTVTKFLVKNFGMTQIDNSDPHAIADYMRQYFRGASSDTAAKEGQLGNAGVNSMLEGIRSIDSEMQYYTDTSGMSEYLDAQAQKRTGLGSYDDTRTLRNAIDAGVVTEEQLYGMTQEQVVDMVEGLSSMYETARDAAGGSYSRTQFFEDNRSQLAASVSNYASDAFSASRTTNDVNNIVITLKFEDGFGQYVTEVSRDYVMRNRLNEGSDGDIFAFA